MHHIDLKLFKYQLEFMQEILKNTGGKELQMIFDDHLRQISHFLSLKLPSKLGQLKVATASDYHHIMKLALFALDNIFSEWDEITCSELCDLYSKFNNMYMMSRKESYIESNIKNSR